MLQEMEYDGLINELSEGQHLLFGTYWNAVANCNTQLIMSQFGSIFHAFSFLLIFTFMFQILVNK